MTHSRRNEAGEITRRDVLKAGAATALVVGVGGGMLRGQAVLAATDRVKGYGVTTSQLKDWSVMAKSIGVEMKFIGTDNVPGIFMRDVIANRLGEEVDIFVFEGGTQDVLGPQGFYAEVQEDHPELTLWQRTEDAWKRSELVVGKDGKQYGVPVIGNADSFGYFPDKLGVADLKQELSWAVMFEDDKTRGRVAYDQTWTYSFPSAALYLQHHGRAQIENVVDMTGEEAKRVADFLIERKRAGQFRTLHTAFEEQIQLLVNKEVDVINCWEPATREANLQLGPGTVVYAYTEEGYFKWGHGAYVASQALQRDNLDAIYKVLNYYLGGEYRAYQARDRGYAGPNMDLGVQYAMDNGWPQEQVDGLKETQEKVKRKFAKPYTSTVTPQHADEMEAEWQRFLNA